MDESESEWAVGEGNVVLYWRRNGQCCMVKGN